MVERNYTKNIIDLLERQRQKGIAKYGQIIEDNTTLTSFQRIEHFEEELMDALMYAHPSAPQSSYVRQLNGE